MTESQNRPDEISTPPGDGAQPTAKPRGKTRRAAVWTGKLIARPYIEAGRSVKRLQATLRRLGQTLGGGAEDLSGVEYIEDVDSGTAFEHLYKLNGWTKDDLQRQRKAVVRAKFWALGLAIVCFGASTFGVLSIGKLSFLPFAAVGIGLSCGALAIALFVSNTISQTQIDDRKLLSAAEFFARRDKWLLFFSS
jgi:hypothetical protein